MQQAEQTNLMLNALQAQQAAQTGTSGHQGSPRNILEYKAIALQEKLSNDAKDFRSEGVSDFADTANFLAKTSRRKAAPPWSLPSELWLILMEPAARFGTIKQTRGVGYVEEKNQEAPFWQQRF